MNGHTSTSSSPSQLAHYGLDFRWMHLDCFQFDLITLQQFIQATPRDAFNSICLQLLSLGISIIHRHGSYDCRLILSGGIAVNAHKDVLERGSAWFVHRISEAKMQNKPLILSLMDNELSSMLVLLSFLYGDEAQLLKLTDVMCLQVSNLAKKFYVPYLEYKLGAIAAQAGDASRLNLAQAWAWSLLQHGHHGAAAPPPPILPATITPASSCSLSSSMEAGGQAGCALPLPQALLWAAGVDNRQSDVAAAAAVSTAVQCPPPPPAAAAAAVAAAAAGITSSSASSSNSNSNGSNGNGNSNSYKALVEETSSELFRAQPVNSNNNISVNINSIPILAASWKKRKTEKSPAKYNGEHDSDTSNQSSSLNAITDSQQEPLQEINKNNNNNNNNNNSEADARSSPATTPHTPPPQQPPPPPPPPLPPRQHGGGSAAPWETQMMSSFKVTLLHKPAAHEKNAKGKRKANTTTTTTTDGEHNNDSRQQQQQAATTTTNNSNNNSSGLKQLK